MTKPGFTTAGFLRLAVLGAWLAAFAWLLCSNHYQALLRAELGVLLAGGLVLLATFFLAVCLQLGRPTSCRAATLGHWTQVAVLLVPLVYLAGTSSTGLGSAAFATRRVARQILPVAAGAKAGGQVTVLDLLGTARQLEGVEVVLDGLVFRDPALPDDQFILFRFMIVCCAADAVPLGVRVQHAEAVGPATDTWVRVTGTVRVVDTDGEDSPLVEAARLEPIAPPVSPYLTPW